MITRGTVLAAGAVGSVTAYGTTKFVQQQRKWQAAGDIRGDTWDEANRKVLPVIFVGSALTPLIAHFGGPVPQSRWLRSRATIGFAIGGLLGLGLGRTDLPEPVLGVAALAPLALALGVSAPMISRSVAGYLRPQPLGAAAATLRNGIEEIVSSSASPTMVRARGNIIARRLAAPLTDIAASARGHRRGTTDAVERQLLDRISTVAGENAQRVMRDVKDGWRNYPDYAGLGRMATNIELFDAVRLAAHQLDDSAARTAAIRGSAEAAEILRW